MNFCNSKLSNSEAERLRGAIDPLIHFLGSPGDWGYGTVLGNLTITLRQIRNEIPSATSTNLDDITEFVDLAKTVANLNPNFPEIGEGMLVNIVTLALTALNKAGIKA